VISTFGGGRVDPFFIRSWCQIQYSSCNGRSIEIVCVKYFWVLEPHRHGVWVGLTPRNLPLALTSYRAIFGSFAAISLIAKLSTEDLGPLGAFPVDLRAHNSIILKQSQCELSSQSLNNYLGPLGAFPVDLRAHNSIILKQSQCELSSQSLSNFFSYPAHSQTYRTATY